MLDLWGPPVCTTRVYYYNNSLLKNLSSLSVYFLFSTSAMARRQALFQLYFVRATDQNES